MDFTLPRSLLLVSLLLGCQSSPPNSEPAQATEPADEMADPEQETADSKRVASAKAEPALTSAIFDGLWNYQDPAGTREKFETLLDAEGENWSADLRLQLMTQIARAFGLQREFDSSHAILDEVEEALPDGPSVARIRYSIERGRSFRSNKQEDESRPHFIAAWQTSLKIGESYYAVDAAHMLGILEQGQASLDWNAKAMATAEASDDPRAKRWLGALYNNTGWTHHEDGNYQLAMDLWVKAEAWHKEFGSPRSHRIALWTIARCERSFERFERALELQLKILAMDVDKGETGYTHEEVAENLWALGMREESRAHFQAASEILGADKWLQANEAERLERLARLAGGADE
jgi:tetratricopeptide (TPR) repeat protein